MKVTDDSAPAAQATTSGGDGLPLPNTVERQMGLRFHQDFSDIRVFTAPDASLRTHGVGATAYARGNELHFKPGSYDPHTRNGQQLIAHELAHVAQQRQGRVFTP